MTLRIVVSDIQMCIGRALPSIRLSLTRQAVCCAQGTDWTLLTTQEGIGKELATSSGCNG